MWVNKRYEVESAMAWLKEFVLENTLSTIITHDPVRVAHMPVELRNEDGEDPNLVFHVPVVDPVAGALVDQSVVTVVVHGPQQYISPSLYADEGLPTFNYGIAEITGRCRTLTQDELSDHLERLMLQREDMFARATGGPPWAMNAGARERFDILLPMVTGFELGLDTMQLKLKMGQNRSRDDRGHTVHRLRNVDGVDARVTSIMETLL